MDWQELAVFALALAAAFYAGRVFLQQFGAGKKTKEEHCAHCGPDKTAQHGPLHFLKKKTE